MTWLGCIVTLAWHRKQLCPATPACFRPAGIQSAGQDAWLCEEGVGRVWVQDLLVAGVRVGAGAGLAVLGGPHGGVAEESGGTLLTELALGVVQAALHQSRSKTHCH